MDDVKPGDVVMARAGGPPMTVTRHAVAGDKQSPFICGWFVQDDPGGRYTGEYREATFSAAALRSIQAAPRT